MRQTVKVKAGSLSGLPGKDYKPAAGGCGRDSVDSTVDGRVLAPQTQGRNIDRNADGKRLLEEIQLSMTESLQRSPSQP